MKKIIIIITVSLVILGLSVWLWNRSGNSVDRRDAVLAWVNTLRVQAHQEPSYFSTIGTITAASVEITPEIAGHVKDIAFHDGALIAAQDILLQLDDQIYQTKYQATQAKLALSETNYHRMSTLVKKGSISQQAIDQALAEYKENQALAHESAVMVKKLQLRAPFTGQISKSKVNLGDYVTVGQSIATLTDIKHLRVEYFVPEKLVSAIKLGQSISVATASYEGKRFTGKIIYIAPTINVENRSILVNAELNNQDGLLRGGMFVNVTHALDRNETMIMVPARSLVPILNGEQVYKILDGKAYSAVVTTGKRRGDLVQIVSGVKSGDEIITDGQQKLKNGSAVQIKNAPKL